MKRLVVSLFVGLCPVVLLSQVPDIAVQSIMQEELLQHMKILASDSMEGRKTGEPGIEKAKLYLLDEISQLGLTNPVKTGTPFVQEYNLYRSGWQEYYLVNQSDTMRLGLDLIVQGTMPELEGEYEFIFAGFGMDQPGYNSYRGLDVRGKIVLYFIGEPKDKSGNYLTTGNKLTAYPRYEGKKDSIAFAKGAISTIRIDPSMEMADRLIRSGVSFGSANRLSLTPNKNKGSQNRNYVLTSIRSAAKILGVTQEELAATYQSLLNCQKKYVSLSGQLTAKGIRFPETVVSGNVAALVEGSDLKDELVIITAHYDHLGIKEQGICYGADDNASGTLGVLEIAEAFSVALTEGYRPRRSILFLMVSGEEMGLFGSNYYCSNPLYPLDKTHAVINMDMIGRHDKAHPETEPYVYVYVSGEEGEWMHQSTRKALENLETELVPEFQFKSSSTVLYGGSDHMPFEQKGIPVAYFFNGIHPDYHKPADTWEKIDYKQMQETLRLVLATAWQLAN